MPTVQRVGPYRLVFYSSDADEPPHIHVERDEYVAKFWLAPIRLARSGGFHRAELREIERIVTAHRGHLLEVWHEHFSG